MPELHFKILNFSYIVLIYYLQTTTNSFIRIYNEILDHSIGSNNWKPLRYLRAVPSQLLS